jgi:ABC-type transport system involved in cytochrome c biogenesis permease subunit
MGDAFRAGDQATFAKVNKEYAGWLAIEHPEWSWRTTYELHFNAMMPFYRCMYLYVGAFLLACASWLVCPKGLRKTAFLLLVLALVVHSFGMFSRMYLQGRPPVTNLYSSAIFVGWGAVVIGIVLERLFRDGIGAASSGMVGFITLIVAHHLGSNGDTLEMMQAVLDSNFWLATHVVVITAGYSAMFLAGFLAIAYVVLGMFTQLLTRDAAKRLTGMVYGVICFATLFSFVGTVLGGIWADQSWGRFWGWDPKENGALLIVLWCALILHARWGGFIRQRGLMAMAIFGNAITAFSWFGVNMLGVGLHSYGFMDKAFPWLVGFVIAQVVLILLAQVPLEKWRSFAKPLKA